MQEMNETKKNFFQCNAIVLLFGCLCLTCHGMVDLDGNGASELWEGQYPGIAVDETDSDGDGISNLDEAICGTDPFDAESVLRLEAPVIRDGDGLVELTWSGMPGKIYTVQIWNGDSWEPVAELTPSTMEGIRLIQIPLPGEAAMYRLTVRDNDDDKDGVSAWEESLLGWSDQSLYGSGSETVPDYENVIRLLESPEGVTLIDGKTIPQRLPDADEASRFLVQTSFGPTDESISEVMTSGMTGWVESQLEMAPVETRYHMFRTGQPISAIYWRHGWWRAVLISPDQLRHRMAYALSQIFVVNNEPGTVIGDNALVQAAYYDPLVNGAFGRYRDLLNHVAYSSTMGFYLSHLNNRKSDPSLNRFPDENFAREIMQLFSIGLWELELDGTRRKDPGGNDIPTYDNSVITELAKVFTGMSHTKSKGKDATSFYDSSNGNDYIHPMKVWDEEHESGQKVLFGGVVIPEGQTGEEDVQQALDALSTHRNTAPFISRLLIQRLTSSNPSPAYIRRVVSAWNGGDGNLDRVIRAIVFDPEVRTIDRGTGVRGKVREPLLRMTHIMRAFALPDDSGDYGVLAPTLKTELGQFAMSSPTVFNFYLPDYSPVGPLQEEGLVAPELQIATASSLLATHDRLKSTASVGHWVRGVDYAEELSMLGDPEGLIDHLDTLLTYGQLSSTTREAARGRILREITDINKVSVAVQMIVTSPEFSILR